MVFSQEPILVTWQRVQVGVIGEGWGGGWGLVSLVQWPWLTDQVTY